MLWDDEHIVHREHTLEALGTSDRLQRPREACGRSPPILKSSPYHRLAIPTSGLAPPRACASCGPTCPRQMSGKSGWSRRRRAAARVADVLINP